MFVSGIGARAIATNRGLIEINGSNPLKTNLERVVDIFKELKGGE